jgi:D-alanyl-D-alanine carboxypeptidase
MWARIAVVSGVLAAALVGRASAAEPSVTARAAVIVDAVSGETIWEKNADLPLPPASTTKVMTAILALESGRLDDLVTVSPDASAVAPSKIGLRPGERMALGDLVYAVLLNSANDASTVVAEGLAGSEVAFARHMNAKAKEIGARNSNFVNPHGLTAARTRVDRPRSLEDLPLRASAAGDARDPRHATHQGCRAIAADQYA